MKLAHNIEIVAFVASVGHISMEPMEHYPLDSNGDESDPKIIEWRNGWKKWWDYLKTIDRAQVDSNEVSKVENKTFQKLGLFMHITLC